MMMMTILSLHTVSVHVCVNGVGTTVVGSLNKNHKARSTNSLQHIMNHNWRGNHTTAFGAAPNLLNQFQVIRPKRCCMAEVSAKLN